MNLSVRTLEQNIVMIQIHLLRLQILWLVFVRTWRITTHAEKEKY